MWNHYRSASAPLGDPGQPKTRSRPSPPCGLPIRPAALALSLIGLALLTLSGCGGGSGTPAFSLGGSGISISFSQVPPSPLLTGAQAMVIATVANDPANMGVDWRVSCASSKCGSFSPAHTASGGATAFTAPASAPPSDNRVNITAVSTADPTKTVTATVALTNGISISFAQPPPSSMQPGGTASLTATVTNDSAGLGVDWTAVGCGGSVCGSFNPPHTTSGAPTTYTAPSSAGSLTIIATATADSSKIVTAVVKITGPPISVTLAQPLVSSALPAGVTLTLSATVTNDSTNAGVDWAASCQSSSCGSFSPAHTASGAPTVYTAPATVPTGGTVTITATATADKTKVLTVTITITAGPPAAVSIAFTPSQSPPSFLQTGATATLGATVTNDSTNAGVDWTVTCKSSTCGSFNPAHTASAGTTTFTAPTSLPTGDTVTITAAATADPTKTVTATVTIRSAGRSGLLVGRYAFLLTGTDANGFYAAAGSITADGFGSISAGEEDFIDTAGAHNAVTITGGTYVIGNDGRGTMTLNSSDTTIGVQGVQTLSFAVVSTQHALIIEFDASVTSSGSLDLQSPNNFFQSSISGGYSFVFSGVDLKSKAAMDLGGVMTADAAGNFTAVAEDTNDGGIVTANTSTSGTYTALDSSGRGTATLGSSTFVYYVINSATLRFVETDSNGLTAGSAFAQGTGPFSNASLSGNFAFTLAGKSTTGAFVAGGLFSSDGNGNITSGTVDVNNAGTVTTATPTGTYTVASNGRATLTFSGGNTGGLSQFAVYLTASQSNPVLLLELDSGLTTSGTALAQASGISASTFKGNYAVNFDAATKNGEEDLVGQLASDGASALSGNADISQLGGTPTPGAALTGAFSANSNGRFSGTLSTSSTVTLNEVFYVVNSSTALLTEVDATSQATGVLQLQQFPSGLAISIAFTQGQAPPASLATLATATISATVTNDSTNAGVDWAVGCGASGCGSFSATHTTSGGTTTFTAPASVPSNSTVTITATATADPTKTATATVTINGTSAGISIAITQPAAPLFSLAAGTSAQVAATVTNDSSNAGVGWSVACGSSGSSACGSFSAAQTASGSPTTYTAPGSVPAGGTVTITATALADPTKTATATATITTGTSSEIVVTFTQTPPPPTSLLTSQQATLGADVQNDSQQLGVDWKATCQSSDCGSFNPTHTASDVQTTYTAPASVPTGGTVTIIATATADPTKSAVTNPPVTIVSAGTTPLLKGQYAFFFTGLDSNGFSAAAGSIIADGFGNITAGEEDFYDTSSQQPQVSLTGTYTIGADGRGTMALTPITGTIGVCGPNGCLQTLSFVVVSPQHALIIAFDGSTTSSGSLDLQTSSNFSLSSISGGYSFTFSGVDLKTKAVMDVGGIMTADGKGNFTSVTEDVNDGGKVTTNISASGTYNDNGLPDSFGRGQAHFGSSTFFYYVVNSGELRFIETDANGFTAGTAFSQGTSLSNGSLSGNFAFTVAGKSTTGSLVAGGLFTSDGNGNITSGTVDVNNAGTVTNGTSSGTYTVSSRGRGTLAFSGGNTGGLSQFAVYLTSNASSPVLLLELDSGLTSSGAALAQTSGISASTLSGDYAVSFEAAIQNGEEDLAGEVFSDGVSALGGNANINQFLNNVGTPTSNIGLAGGFTAGSNGRFTGTLQTGPTGTLNEIFYVANSSTVLSIETDAGSQTAGPATGLLQLQQFPQQFAIPIFAAFTPLPPSSVQTGAQAMLTIIVANDSANKGVDWSVTCPSSPCGSFSPTHTASGAPTTFTAPASPASGGTVTITATATADNTKTVTATLAIGATLSIAFTQGQAPPSSMEVNATASISATVANDPANKGVDWSVACQSSQSDCGFFFPTHTASGVATIYTAPGSIPDTNTVTITATATADSTKTTTATVTITGPPPSITFLQAPPSSLQTDTQASVSADVQNDPKNLGVDWSVTCGSSDCGSFNPTHTANDSDTVYTAPASVPASGSVTIIATATANPAATATQQVTITAVGPETGLLKGQYAFSFTGTDDNRLFYAAVGSLTADGAGNITAGEEDFYDVNTFPPPVTLTNLTGTYTIGSDGRGTMALTNTGGIGVCDTSGNCVQTLSLAAVSAQRALVTEFDTSATSSGSLDLQTSTNFSLGSISGAYSFIFSGLDLTKFPATSPLNFGGVLTADGKGHFKNGTEDVNDNGTVTANTSTSGTYAAPDSTFGRGTATLGSSAFVYYVVNSGTLRFLETDINGLTVGSAFAQPAGLSTASLSGNFAFTMTGKNSAGGPLVVGGLFTSDGSGNITTASVDVNNAGTVTSDTPSGTYSVASNGRGTITFSAPTGGVSQFGVYLTPNLPGLAAGQMGVLVVDLDSGLTASGAALAQSSGISASTFSGNYAASFDGAITSGEQDAVGQVVSNGTSSALSGAADINQLVIDKFGTTSTLTPDDALTGGFNANSDGRFTGTLNASATGTLNEIFYVVNSSTVLFIETDTSTQTTGPATGLLELQQFSSTAGTRQHLKRQKVIRDSRAPVANQQRRNPQQRVFDRQSGMRQSRSAGVPPCIQRQFWIPTFRGNDCSRGNECASVLLFYKFGYVFSPSLLPARPVRADIVWPTAESRG